jgi:cytoskeleton protein RodZ
MHAGGLAVSEDASSIGRQLRAARERMGLGVAQAAEQMHVDESVIDALESGKFKALGAPVYVRGHLRHYAELLGEPGASGLYESLQEQPPDLTSGPHIPVQRLGPRRRWPLVLFAVLLAVAAAVWWAVGVQAR